MVPLLTQNKEKLLLLLTGGLHIRMTSLCLNCRTLFHVALDLRLMDSYEVAQSECRLSTAVDGALFHCSCVNVCEIITLCGFMVQVSLKTVCYPRFNHLILFLSCQISPFSHHLCLIFLPVFISLFKVLPISSLYLCFFDSFLLQTLKMANKIIIVPL